MSLIITCAFRLLSRQKSSIQTSIGMVAFAWIFSRSSGALL
ncbi:hypothetical protein ACMD2_12327 [Ananas comosus]|uniref:Uncharacterized protein n=1 Tax=Ananas comosus TaxID=4615 RepID=A0A199UZP9_ANACO|nr:hypothetical protein ACMD2_12327 [Ananas comosus]